VGKRRPSAGTVVRSDAMIRCGTRPSSAAAMSKAAMQFRTAHDDKPARSA